MAGQINIFAAADTSANCRRSAQAEKCPAQIVGKIGFYLSPGGPVACDQRMKPDVRPFVGCLCERTEGHCLGAISHHRRNGEPGNVGVQIILLSERGSVSSFLVGFGVASVLMNGAVKCRQGCFPRNVFRQGIPLGFITMTRSASRIAEATRSYPIDQGPPFCWGARLTNLQR